MNLTSRLAFGFATLFLIGATKASAQQSNTVTVKGPVHIDYVKQPSLAATHPLVTMPTVATITFIRASTAAGPNGANLNPGQGAWENGPLTASQPAKVELLISGEDFTTTGWLKTLSGSSSVLTVPVQVRPGDLMCEANPFRHGGAAAPANRPVVTPGKVENAPIPTAPYSQAPKWIPPAQSGSSQPEQKKTPASPLNKTPVAGADKWVAKPAWLAKVPPKTQVQVHTQMESRQIAAGPQTPRKHSPPMTDKKTTGSIKDFFADSGFKAITLSPEVMASLNTTSTDSADIDKFIESVGIYSVPPATSTDPNQGGKQNISDLTLFNAADGVIYPGALLIASTLDTSPTPISLPRSPMKFTVDTLQGAGPVSATMPKVLYSDYAGALATLLAGRVPGGGSASYNYYDAYASDQVALSLGVKASYMGAKLQADVSTLNFKSSTNMNATYNQSYYTVSVDLPDSTKPSSVFAPGVSVADVMNASKDPTTGAISPIAYVQSVTYGRQGVMFFTSSSSRSDLKASVEASYAGQDVKAGVDIQKVSNNTQSTLFLRGGDPNLAGQAAAGLTDMTTAAAGFNNWLKAPVTTTTLEQVVPVSYKVNFLKNNATAQIQLTTQFPTGTASPFLTKWHVVFDTNDYYVPYHTTGRLELRYKKISADGKTASCYPPDLSPGALYAYVDLVNPNGDVFAKDSVYDCHLTPSPQYTGPPITVKNIYLFDLVITMTTPNHQGIQWYPYFRVLAGNDGWEDGEPDSYQRGNDTVTSEKYPGVYDITENTDFENSLLSSTQVAFGNWSYKDNNGMGTGNPVTGYIDFSESAPATGNTVN